MDLQSLLDTARSRASSAFSSLSEIIDATTSTFGTGLGYAKQSLTMSWLFGSNERADTKCDEKHYFLIPYKIAECHYTLYAMRCLPDGVPPVNDLPKRRIFHLPNEHASRMVEKLLCDDAANSVQQESASSGSRSRLIDLADRIDQVDQQAFNGALLIGGLVALANPVAGGLLAAKAMIPSIGLLLAKYGLQQAGESLNESNLQSKIKRAEKQVLAEFHGTTATQIVEPLLEQLDRAINTTEFEYDPIVDEPISIEPVSEQAAISTRLTMTAIVNTYDELLQDRKRQSAAGLGPEDIRWLELLKVQVNAHRQT